MLQLTTTDYQAILLSVKIGAVATILALPLGFVVAYLMTYGRFKGKLILELLVNLPLTLPPVVIGYLLLLLLGRNGWLGALLDRAGISLIFTWKAGVLASMVVGFPLLVRAIRIAMETIYPQLIQAARTLGAGRLDAMLTVVLPLSNRGLLAGSSLLFARSLGEFGATIIVAGNIPGVTQTIPLAIYDYAASPRGESIALILCGVALILSLAVLLVHEQLSRKLQGEY